MQFFCYIFYVFFVFYYTPYKQDSFFYICHLFLYCILHLV